MDDVKKLLDQVSAEAQAQLGDALVSLYVYGSAWRGDMNGWSDVDICLVTSHEARSRCADWVNGLRSKPGFSTIDPVILGIDDLDSNSHWMFAPFLRALINNSMVLCGTDIRPQIVMPTEHKLLVSMCDSAFRWIRGLYDIPFETKLPWPLDVLEINNCNPRPSGSIAWQFYITALQLMRGILYIEKGIFCESKRSIGSEAARTGDAEMQKAYQNAVWVREHCPRYGLLDPVSAEVQSLASMVPAFAQRFYTNTIKKGLADPAYQPDGQPAYDSEGILIA